MTTYHTTASHIEAMAHDHPGAQVELTADAAYLTIAGITWRAPLERVA